ncbi:MAG TPA: deoxynucleoside kinase [Anaerolineales bacterium]|nr:deoxynucleoside kinase [Anaerolineales bacterium]
MGRLIAVIGNCGSGKTALTRALSGKYRLTPLLEQHVERPFQAEFQSDLLSYALANQFDYLLFRAGQELSLRASGDNGIVDGGLDQDFHVFTKLFLQKGFLDQREYDLCERLYLTLRQTLHPPDLFVRLTTPLETLRQRRFARSRSLDIVTAEDLPAIDGLLADWMDGNAIPVIHFDTSADDPGYSRTTAPLLAALDRFRMPK